MRSMTAFILNSVLLGVALAMDAFSDAGSPMWTISLRAVLLMPIFRNSK